MTSLRAGDRAVSAERPKRRFGVVLASAGRPALLAESVSGIAHLDGVEISGVISVPDECSLPADRTSLAAWRILVGARGVSVQRNVALDALPDVDFVAFFDDDSVVRSDYLVHAANFFADHPDVIGITGRVVLDGATTGEVSSETADAALRRSLSDDVVGPGWRPSRTLYGCNFVVRSDALEDIRFDERLALYSWLEDHDLARRLMRRGRLAKVEHCVIVHRGADSGGRKAHHRFGYSQVINPLYLWRKGSFPLWLAVEQVTRPVAKNVSGSLVGPARAWRRQRLYGNLRAMGDAVRGRLAPERIIELSA